MKKYVNVADPQPPSESAKPDNFHAKVAFYLSLGFWIPLLNVALCLTALYVAVGALKCILRDPQKKGGFGYAVTAIVLSLTSLVFTVVGTLVYFLSSRICGSAVCQLTRP